jgi:hypothetical protein
MSSVSLAVLDGESGQTPGARQRQNLLLLKRWDQEQFFVAIGGFGMAWPGMLAQYG